MNKKSLFTFIIQLLQLISPKYLKGYINPFPLNTHTKRTRNSRKNVFRIKKRNNKKAKSKEY